MGVMGCDRKGCKNIMCNTYAQEIGYVCYECKTELEDSNPTSLQDVKDFMDLDKERKYLNDEGEFDLKEFFGEDDKDEDEEYNRIL